MNMAIINCVREYRKQHDLTQEQLASKVRVTRQTIIALEKGSYVPSLELAIDVAAVFGVSVETLFQKEREGKH